MARRFAGERWLTGYCIQFEEDQAGVYYKFQRESVTSPREPWPWRGGPFRTVSEAFLGASAEIRKLAQQRGARP